MSDQTERFEGSRRGQTLLRGHSLVGEGAPYGADGRPAISKTWGHTMYGGPGRGKCSCGVLSDELPSAAARKRWHREHKEAMRRA